MINDARISLETFVFLRYHRAEWGGYQAEALGRP